MKHRIFAALILGVVAATGLALPGLAAGNATLHVLSSRPDMIGGNEALVELTSTGRTNALSVWVNGRNVTKAFRGGQEIGQLVGLVDGLKRGKNTLEARAGDKVEAKLDVIAYPISGPIFSGPHQRPLVCQTNDFQLPITGGTLGPSLDKDCSIATRIDYIYESISGQLKPLPNPSSPPNDVAQTKTKDGRTVNFIIRIETGTTNRAIYQTAILHDPSVDAAPDPWHRPSGWNGRLIYNFGGGCSAGYHQGKTISLGGTGGAIVPQWLALGYATAAATFTTFANNCNDVLSPETAMMVKERFVEHYGPIVHTIGSGGSGGAMQLHIVAQNYPGILDGVMTQATHPDIVSYATNVISDVALLNQAFSDQGLTGLTEDQKSVIAGFSNWEVVGKSWLMFSPGLAVPNGSSCDPSIPSALIYDAVKNPHGTRCTLYDNMVNIFGRNPKTGFARSPLDNVGVEYGLVAFNLGKISAEQFVVLNEIIGGYDTDGHLVPQRTAGDAKAIRIAYSTGEVNEGGGGLATTPIIDTHAYVDENNHHGRADIFMTRDRLIAANGDAGNYVTITMPPGNFAKEHANALLPLPNDVLLKMDEWLDNLAKDPSPSSHLKTVRDKPADLVDGCILPDGSRDNEPASYAGSGKCNEAYPAHGTPRTAAGAPIALDILKCSLKPFDEKAYAHPLSAAQIARLKAVFASGVCDYDRKGFGQFAPQATWRHY